MKLADININAPVTIVELGCSNQLVCRRLNDLGIVEGCQVCIKQRLPFGGPITLEADGQWIAIRRKEALQIVVEAV
ncbi:ferrous iron transport protein A [Paenibacillus uliginis N3/975]|uniref:Ferrous iron transport protein A n=1 Tax=Paenibacillus uliginis N3/975 TaxID=1313296 RepID=A0A1X7G549_9BACL|nr:FeoA family protein [Paenibacillus sp. N3/727]UNK18350.1 ferrous iron transport protein A [Paenibacillus sp. N3/727]SMF64096.1 ferrous iron transport protein A [Paenibacillus uliginis N3/975]